MSGFIFTRYALMVVFLVGGVPVIDKAKKRNVSPWLAWAFWILVMIAFWFTFGYIGGLYA